tara:strand:+ start:517 stop:828 length:312 start_codon:yes stop_codon:yes gene_type:complete
MNLATKRLQAFIFLLYLPISSPSLVYAMDSGTKYHICINTLKTDRWLSSTNLIPPIDNPPSINTSNPIPIEVIPYSSQRLIKTNVKRNIKRNYSDDNYLYEMR